MHKNHSDPKELGLTKPRLASYKQKWKKAPDTVYWVDIHLAQRKGLKFNQTRSNAIILHDTLPACCILKAFMMDTGEIIHQKVFVSLRPPDDEIVGKALSSPLFILEREEPANLRQSYHSHEESLLPAQSFFTRASTVKQVYEPSSNLSQKWKSSSDLENKQIRILLERQKEQIFAQVKTPNESNQNPKTNYQVRRDPYVDTNPQNVAC